MHLSDNLHRALSTRLGIIERQLIEAEVLLASKQTAGVMFEVVNDLTPEQIKSASRLLVEARERVRQLRDRFELTVKREDVRHWLIGNFSILWTILEDTHAAQLRGFGAIPPEMAAQLDPEIDTLIEIVNRIRALAVSPSKSGE